MFILVVLLFPLLTSILDYSYITRRSDSNYFIVYFYLLYIFTYGKVKVKFASSR